tara:strand:+ start:3876 stop:4328 length:453 start_codon:yes stop_codon:yes gene_type:complete
MNKESKRNVYEQLKKDEGVKYEIYADHLGYLTFGVGHLVLMEDEEYAKREGTPVSEERVAEAFQNDLNIALRECRVLYEAFGTFPSEVQEILVNMMFNMGRPRLSKFKNMNKALAIHDWKEAAKEGRDSAWHRQVTNRAERLMGRMENVG